jgi:Ca2+-binding RTX toxin-like protein
VPLFVTVAALALLAPASARADFTSTLSGSVATMTGDGANDRLAIDAEGIFLRHNRFAAGDSGFVSGLDFNSAMDLEQKLANFEGAVLTLNAGGGDDAIVIGNAVAPASTIAASVSANGGAQENAIPGDWFSVWDGNDPTGRGVAITSSAVDGLGGNIGYAGFEALAVTTGSGGDVVTVGTGVPDVPNPSGPGQGTAVDAGGGADRISLAEGVTAAINGGTGSDTLDYGSWTIPVTFRVPEEASLLAFMTPEQEVPANDTDAEGFATLKLSPGTNRFDFEADVTGLPRAEVTGSQIHVAPEAQEGPSVFDLGNGTVWTDEQCFASACIVRRINGATFPAANVADLLSGKTYVHLHTTSFPGGEIRGQFGLERGATFGLENVIGGSAGDSITGNAGANMLDGGPGGDQLHGRPGRDLLIGGAGRDRLFGEDGVDKLRAKDGAADKRINCGAGSNRQEKARRDSIDPPAVSC